MVREFKIKCPNCGSIEGNEVVDRENSVSGCYNENCFVSTFFYNRTKRIKITEYDLVTIKDVVDCPEELSEEAGDKMIIFENYSTNSLRGGRADLRSKEPEEIIGKRVDKVVRRDGDYYLILEGVRGKVEVSTKLKVIEEDE